MRNPVALRVVVASLLAAGLAACSPSLNWRQVQPPQAAGLTAMFPCKPEHVERAVSLPGLEGGPVQMHVLACEADGVNWAVSYLDAGTVERRAAALPALTRALWANMSMGDPASARRSPLGPIQVPGATPHADTQAWWLEGSRPVSSTRQVPVRSKAWYFSKGTVVFQATAWQESLRPDDPRLQAFEEGFTFPG